MGWSIEPYSSTDRVCLSIDKEMRWVELKLKWLGRYMRSEKSKHERSSMEKYYVTGSSEHYQ